MTLEVETVSLVTGRGELIRGSLVNTGFENEYQLSIEGPKWVVVRPQAVRLETNGTGDIFVYMSPEFGVKGMFDATLVADGTCVVLEKVIRAEVQ